jgi:hypothetical protein
MATAELLVKVVTDTTAAAAKLDAAGGKLGKFGTAMKKAALPAAAIVAGITAVGIAAVNSASRTEQAMGGVEAVFGKNAGTVKKWAGAAASSLGLAKSEYGELATLIGSQLKNAGVPMDQLAGKTKTLIEKGADLAAMYGGTTADAVSALSGALKGEFDPMEKYGTSMSAAKIQAEMAAQGTDKLTGAAATQAKAMATLSLVNKQTADSHGAAAREATTTAAKTQQLTATVENLKSDLGTALLPVMAQFLGALATAAAWMSKNSTAVLIVAGVLATLATAVLVVNVALWAMAAAESAAFWPILLIVGGVALLVAAFVTLYRKGGWFRAGVNATFKILAVVVKAAGAQIAAVFRAAFAIASAVVRVFSAVARAVFRGISTAVGWVSSAVSSLKSWLGRLSVPAAVKTALNAVKDAARYAWDKVKSLREKLSDLKVPGAVLTAINAVKEAAGWAIDNVKSLGSWLGKLKVPKLSFPKVPKWLSKAVPGMAAAPAAAGVSARGVTGYASPGAAVVINVNGAIDPEGTARQVGRLLGAHDRRMGTTRGLRVA